MSREVHVRICENPGVRSPRVTRPVMGFSDEADARRVLDVLPKRFGKYGLALHPEKTRLVAFGKPSRRFGGQGRSSDDGPGTFDLLGFRHFWGLSRKGHWVVKRKTAPTRFTRAIQAIARWCRMNRHHPVAAQHETLSQKLRGHYGYYGITGNGSSLAGFRHEVIRIWRKWLGRRKRGERYRWCRFVGLLEHYPLPEVIVVHSVYRRVAKP